MIVRLTFFICIATLSLAAAETLTFNQYIRPILADKCFACHGLDAKKRKAGLRLDVAEGAYREKDGERPIVPGDLAKSAAWKRILSKDPDEVMPPAESHKTLSDAEKATLKLWIEQGAAYQKHWAFEPPIKVPQTLFAPVGQTFLSADTLRQTGMSAPRNEIDTFIIERLAREKRSRFRPKPTSPRFCAAHHLR